MRVAGAVQATDSGVVRSTHDCSCTISSHTIRQSCGLCPNTAERHAALPATHPCWSCCLTGPALKAAGGCGRGMAAKMRVVAASKSGPPARAKQTVSAYTSSSRGKRLSCAPQQRCGRAINLGIRSPPAGQPESGPRAPCGLLTKYYDAQPGFLEGLQRQKPARSLRCQMEDAHSVFRLHGAAVACYRVGRKFCVVCSNAGRNKAVSRPRAMRPVPICCGCWRG